MITITVSGTANSGKSTVAELVYHRLKEASFAVEWKEKPHTTGVDFGKRLDAVAKKTPIKIVEEQLNTNANYHIELFLVPECDEELDEKQVMKWVAEIFRGCDMGKVLVMSVKKGPKES